MWTHAEEHNGSIQRTWHVADIRRHRTIHGVQINVWAGAHDRNVSSKEGGRGYDDVTIGQIRGPQTVRANTGPYIHNHCDAFTLSIAIQEIEHEVSIFDRETLWSAPLCATCSLDGLGPHLRRVLGR